MFFTRRKRRIAASEETPIHVRDADPQEVERVLRQHVYAALGVGFVPLPVVDFILITGIQINLLKALTRMYGLPFTKDPGKKFISSLFASIAPVVSAPGAAASMAKAVPMLGQTAGVITMPLFGAAATYALGKVFIQHFASGGTFLTFDPEQVKAYYAEMLQEGQEMAVSISHSRDRASS